MKREFKKVKGKWVKKKKKKKVEKGSNSVIDELLNVIPETAREVFQAIQNYLILNEKFEEDAALKVALEAIGQHDIWMGSARDGHIPIVLQKAGGDLASGWIKDLYLLGDKGLWALAKLTNEARWLVQDEQMKYLSPTVHKNWKDDKGKKRGMRLIGVALTNIPFFEDMPPIELIGETSFAFVQVVPIGKQYDNYKQKREGYTKQNVQDMYDNFVELTDRREIPMDYEHEMWLATNKERKENAVKLEEYQTQVRDALGVKDEKADLIEMMSNMKKNTDDGKSELETATAALKTAEGKIKDLEASQSEDEKHLSKVLENARALGVQVEELEKKEAARAAKDLEDTAKKTAEIYVDEAIAAHKIRKAERDEYVELYMAKSDTVKKIVDAAKPIVDVEVHGAGVNPDEVEIPENAAKVAKRLGVRLSFYKAMLTGRPESDFAEKKPKPDKE